MGIFFTRIDTAYKARNVQDRLQNLTHTMIKQEKKKPKLRCSGAQCRALVPIVLDLAHKHLDVGKPVEQAALVGMIKLDQCYKALSSESIFSHDVLRECSVEFALQYVALDLHHPGIPYNSIVRPPGQEASILSPIHSGGLLVSGGSAGIFTLALCATL